MLVSDEKKLLFIHIQKTGGTSLSAHFRKEIPDIVLHRKVHTTLTHCDVRYDHYFKAAFVRNPYERLVSWYADIDRNARQNPSPNLVRSQVIERAQSFREFILDCADITSREWDSGPFRPINTTI